MRAALSVQGENCEGWRVVEENSCMNLDMKRGVCVCVGGVYRRCLTVMCVHEPNLPPSAVRAEDVRASEAPGPPSLFLSLSLSLSVLSAHICLSAVEGGGSGGGTGGSR